MGAEQWARLGFRGKHVVRMNFKKTTKRKTMWKTLCHIGCLVLSLATPSQRDFAQTKTRHGGAYRTQRVHTKRKPVRQVLQLRFRWQALQPTFRWTCMPPKQSQQVAAMRRRWTCMPPKQSQQVAALRRC